MPARKTIAVSNIVTAANTVLACDNVTDEYRLGVASLLEHVLHATGNYRGFNYLGVEFPPDAAPVIPNETKRVYYSA